MYIGTDTETDVDIDTGTDIDVDIDTDTRHQTPDTDTDTDTDKDKDTQINIGREAMSASEREARTHILIHKSIHAHTRTHVEIQHTCKQHVLHGFNDALQMLPPVKRMALSACLRARECARVSSTAALCNTLQYTATQCNTLQHNATHCNTRLGQVSETTKPRQKT